MREVIFSKVYQVYGVFQDFFGEEYVDLQDLPSDELILDALEDIDIQRPTEESFEIPDDKLERLKGWFQISKPFILVYWPQVTVTNEYDKSIVIDDLYAKIRLTSEGRIPYENIGFLLNRAKYSKSQFLSNYLHSHIHYIPKSDFTCFETPCLGRGPIIGTIGTLKNECDLTTWMLFCQELSMYVTVESISGVPWNRLETVGNYLGHTIDIYNSTSFYSRSFRDEWSERYIEWAYAFAKYYLKNGHLKLGFSENMFTLGMSKKDFLLDISNSAIDYINNYGSFNREDVQDLFDSKVLISCVMSNGKFYQYANNIRGDVDSYQGKFMCKFKGRDINIRIYDDGDSAPQTVTILSPAKAFCILYNILKIINYRYRNEYNNRHNTASSTSQTICYI